MEKLFEFEPNRKDGHCGQVTDNNFHLATQTLFPSRRSKRLYNIVCVETNSTLCITPKTRHVAMVQNQWYHFGIGAPLILVYFSGDWDVHWGYGVLTHGQLKPPFSALLGAFGSLERSPTLSRRGSATWLSQRPRQPRSAGANRPREEEPRYLIEARWKF